MDTWREEAPAEPGLYWWRYKGSKMAIVLTVYRLIDDGKLYVQQEDQDVLIEKWTDGVWAGPIEPPPITGEVG